MVSPNMSSASALFPIDGLFPYDLVDKSIRSWMICSLIDEFSHEIA
jgi:hypothetical protein